MARKKVKATTETTVLDYRHEEAKRWVSAVNNWGQLGRWLFHVCKYPQVLGRELVWLRKEQ
jgi:type III restriction enzyme